MKQTAVNWLIGELIHKGLMALRYDKDNTFNELIEQAKKMEKEQALQFLSDQSQELNMGYEGEGPRLPMTFPTIECIGDNVWEELTGGQEVSVNRADWSFGFGIGYKKAISDLHDISQNAFLIQNELLEEISYDEIEKKARIINDEEGYRYADGFIVGATWYKEQLRNK